MRKKKTKKQPTVKQLERKHKKEMKELDAENQRVRSERYRTNEDNSDLKKEVKNLELGIERLEGIKIDLLRNRTTLKDKIEIYETLLIQQGILPKKKMVKVCSSCGCTHQDVTPIPQRIERGG